MVSTYWTTDAVKAHLQLEDALRSAGRRDVGRAASTRLMMLQVIELVDRNQLSAETATIRLTELAHTLRDAPSR